MLLITVVIALSFCFSSSLLAHEGHDHSHEVAQLSVENGQVREFLPAAESSVGYLTISNHSKVDAVLVKATIDGLGRVEIHQHKHEGAMMKMEKVSNIEIKAHESVQFQPGGLHLMVFEPQEPLIAGQERKLTLYFKDGNRIFTNIEVISLAEQVEQSTSAKHHSHH